MAKQTSIIRFTGDLNHELIGQRSGYDTVLKKRKSNYKISDGIVQQQERTKLVSNMMKRLVPYLNVMYKSDAKNVSNYLAAISYNVNQAVTGKYPNYTIDYSKVSVSRGSLVDVDGCKATLQQNRLEITWNNNFSTRFASNASVDDVLQPAVYNRTQNKWSYPDMGANRKQGQMQIELPDDWQNDQLELWVAFANAKVTESSHSEYVKIERR